jgi:hypothetical protein
MTKDLCLESIDHCKRFEKIATRLGIKPDGYWVGKRTCNYSAAMLAEMSYEERMKRNLEFKETVEFKENHPFFNILSYLSSIKGEIWYYSTYRQDKLELPLPEWLYDVRSEKRLDFLSKLNEKQMRNVCDLLTFSKFQGPLGEQKRIATVELVELLEKENLLGGKDNDGRNKPII